MRVLEPDPSQMTERQRIQRKRRSSRLQSAVGAIIREAAEEMLSPIGWKTAITRMRPPWSKRYDEQN